MSFRDANADVFFLLLTPFEIGHWQAMI
jgi:hypothetical protein